MAWLSIDRGATAMSRAQPPCPLLFHFISSPFTSFSLLSLPVTLYLPVCLSVSLVYVLILSLNTFEKEGLPSYLGHGIKVTGASVGGISRQTEMGKWRTEEREVEERRSSETLA